MLCTTVGDEHIALMNVVFEADSGLNPGLKPGSGLDGWAQTLVVIYIGLVVV